MVQVKSFPQHEHGSLVAHIVLNHMDALVQAHRVLLHDNLLLHQRVDLLLEEVALVDVVGLQLLEVFLEVSDVLNDLLQDVICRLGSVMLQSRALRAQKLNFLFVIVEQLDCIFSGPLVIGYKNHGIKIIRKVHLARAMDIKKGKLFQPDLLSPLDLHRLH